MASTTLLVTYKTFSVDPPSPLGTPLPASPLDCSTPSCSLNKPHSLQSQDLSNSFIFLECCFFFPPDIHFPLSSLPSGPVQITTLSGERDLPRPLRKEHYLFLTLLHSLIPLTHFISHIEFIIICQKNFLCKCLVIVSLSPLTYNPDELILSCSRLFPKILLYYLSQ